MGKGLRSFGQSIRKIPRPQRGSPGQNSNHKYKVSTDGKYGNLFIDLNKLYSQNKLIAKDSNGKEVMNTKADDDLIDLINKRFDNKRTHSIHSRLVFKELTEKSGLPINKRSMKFNKIIKGGNNVCSCDPKELINDLELICGSIESGNNNQELKNEGISIIDELLKTGNLLPSQHESLYKTYFFISI